MLFDAHNHLQDLRLSDSLGDILSVCKREGISRMVVNGTRESDWPRVLELAQNHSLVLPSFGFHPWFLNERTVGWRDNFLRHLDAVPSTVGEIGLDRWMKDPDTGLQEEMFRWQLRVAAERNLPVTIHCLKAWGRLDEILREEPLSATGFLLHSYAGPAEMISGFAKLGGYFSLSGHLAHEQKLKQREAFKQVPLDRILIETDAPDMAPPESLMRHPLTDPVTHNPVNHPANLKSIYEFAAGLFEIPTEKFTAQIKRNFARLFSNE